MANRFGQAPTTENSYSRRRPWLLPVFLFVLVAASFCLLGYSLGKRSAPSGALMDTIVLTPVKPAAVPLTLSGAVRYADGEPYANGALELRSEPRVTLTDTKGRFMFYDVENGEHRVAVLNGAGERIAEVEVIIAEGAGSGARLSIASDGSYTLFVAADVLLVEMTIELGENGELALDPESITTVSQNGLVDTPNGSANAAEDGVVLTPGGASVHPDGTINLPYGGVILNDGTYIAPDGSVTLADGSGTIGADGSVTLEDGTAIAPGGEITLPNGKSISPGQTDGLPDGVYVSPDGAITLPDGTRVMPDGTVRLPGGTKVSPDNDVTFPNGENIDPEKTRVLLPDSTEIDLAGGATLPDGTVIDDNRITLPDGTVIDNENKTVTTPGGAVISHDDITLPDGGVVDTTRPGTLPDGTVVGEDGSVTLPDGSVIAPDGTVIAPDGTQIIPPDDGGYIIGGDSDRPISGAHEPETPDEPETPTQTTRPPAATTPPDTPPSPPSPPPGPSTHFTLTVVKGSGSGRYAAGARVTIVANAPATGQTFEKWTKTAGAFADATSATTTFTMPARNATVTANYIEPFPPGSKPTVYDMYTGSPISWDSMQYINLFETSDTAVTGKIYPGVTGSYNFRVSNPNAFAVKFDMTITEATHAAGNIPFNYKLKSGGSYIGGDTWRTATDFQSVVATLAANSAVDYTLEWQWPFDSGDDARDTAIGANTNKTHYVTIEMHIEQVT